MKELTVEDKDLEAYPCALVSEKVRERFILDTEAQKMDDKPGMYYSQDIGLFSQRKINSVLKSKFKAEFERYPVSGKTTRCVGFKQNYLDRIKSYYKIPDKIEIVNWTPRTPRTPGESIQTDLKSSDEHEKEGINRSEHPRQASEASEASKTKPRPQTTCSKCGTLPTTRFI